MQGLPGAVSVPIQPGQMAGGPSPWGGGAVAPATTGGCSCGSQPVTDASAGVRAPTPPGSTTIPTSTASNTSSKESKPSKPAAPASKVLGKGTPPEGNGTGKTVKGKVSWYGGPNDSG